MLQYFTYWFSTSEKIKINHDNITYSNSIITHYYKWYYNYGGYTQGWTHIRCGEVNGTELENKCNHLADHMAALFLINTDKPTHPCMRQHFLLLRWPELCKASLQESKVDCASFNIYKNMIKKESASIQGKGPLLLYENIQMIQDCYNRDLFFVNLHRWFNL